MLINLLPTAAQPADSVARKRYYTLLLECWQFAHQLCLWWRQLLLRGLRLPECHVGDERIRTQEH
jgi:hypothetical protein